MSVAVERLYSGIFECPDCGIEYEADRATEDDLFCEECGSDIVETEPDSSPAEDAETDDAEAD